jgi:hypothetical protein
LARRRRPDEIETVKLRGSQILERISLDEDVAAIVGLTLEIDANDVIACLLQAACGAAGAAIEIKRVQRASHAPPLLR